MPGTKHPLSQRWGPSRGILKIFKSEQMLANVSWQWNVTLRPKHPNAQPLASRPVPAIIPRAHMPPRPSALSPMAHWRTVTGGALQPHRKGALRDHLKPIMGWDPSTPKGACPGRGHLHKLRGGRGPCTLTKTSHPLTFLQL